MTFGGWTTPRGPQPCGHGASGHHSGRTQAAGDPATAGSTAGSSAGGTYRAPIPRFPTGMPGMPDNAPMRLSAKADYAVRAAVELAAVEGQGPRKAERIAEAQSIPIKFLETILLELKHAGIVRSQRGPDGGYALARPAAAISIADVIRAVDGPLANVRGDRPENIVYTGAAAKLTDLWIAVRAALRDLLETTSLADVRDARLPERVVELAADPDAWVSLGRIRGTGGSGPARAG